jgi:hypothetical protein
MFILRGGLVDRAEHQAKEALKLRSGRPRFSAQASGDRSISTATGAIPLQPACQVMAVSDHDRMLRP